MGRRRKQMLPAEPVRARIDGMAHDGRGVAHLDDKTVFIEGALPEEEVWFTYSSRRSKFDEGQVTEVISASPERVTPKCAHFGVCGGCSLQHQEPAAQIRNKQQVLLDNFRRLGGVAPEQLMDPIIGPVWGYRRKARLGVKYVKGKGRVLVGFRERRSPFVAALERCEVLHPSVGGRLTELAQLIGGLSAFDRIAQIEVAVDDTQTALVLRNLEPLTDEDRRALCDYAAENDLRLFLQPGGPQSVEPLWPDRIQLGYALPEFDLRYGFLPTDFTQVNFDINRAMVPRALELLALAGGERVLDLFCGLGNFTLPIARRAREVVGVEGEAALVSRARENAAANGLTNVTFHAADLTGELGSAPWWQGGFDRVLIDPPRSGAEETLGHVARLGVPRIVYVSCNPSTLARDAGILVKEHGFRLEQAGVMDMFPHTAHVESIALFTHKQ